MPIDGHTHTELCPHGSKEPTSKMVKRAIQLGFTEYHLTEHAPLPTKFMEQYAGNMENVDTASLRWDQVDEYLRLGHQLQKQFQDQIKITVGFEVDYLEDYEAEIRQFLDEVGPETENSIISVHYLKNADGQYYGIDYSPEELRAGFSTEIDDGQRLYHRYLTTVLKSVQADFGQWLPTKIGHMSLIKKYQDYFHLPTSFSDKNMAVVDQVLEVASQKKLKLDFNTAGLYKSYCNEPYPGLQVIKNAQKLGVPMEFGSDAHSVSDVGHGFHLFDYF